MKLKSLFEVIFKVLGVYVIINSFVYLPQLLSVFSPYDSSWGNMVFFTLTIIASFLILLLLGLLLIVKAESITLKILPESRLEEDFTTFKVHRSTVLTIAVIILGGLILFDEIPMFFMTFFQNYNQYRSISSSQPSNLFDNYMFYSVVKIILATYLIYKNKEVVAFIEKRRKQL